MYERIRALGSRKPSLACSFLLPKFHRLFNQAILIPKWLEISSNFEDIDVCYWRSMVMKQLIRWLTSSVDLILMAKYSSMIASLSSSRLSGSVSSLLMSLNRLLLAFPYDIFKLTVCLPVCWLPYLLGSFGSPTPTISGSESSSFVCDMSFSFFVISADDSSPVTVVFLLLCIFALLLFYAPNLFKLQNKI